MNAYLLILTAGISLLAFKAAGEETGLPNDSIDLIAKLQKFEKEQQQRTDAVISEKRRSVVAVLKHHLSRETKSGNLDTALELRKLIDSLNKPIAEGNEVIKKAAAEADEMNEFSEWVKSIELHEAEGWWEISGDFLLQHLEGGGERRFPYEIDQQKKELSFVGSGRKYTFQFLADQTRGIRSRNDDWPPCVFSVKRKR